MVSCSEQPAHATCVWWYASPAQNQFPGSACATRESSRISAIMSSMTKPRYVSTAILRGSDGSGGGGETGCVALTGEGLTVACMLPMIHCSQPNCQGGDRCVKAVATVRYPFRTAPRTPC